MPDDAVATKTIELAVEIDADPEAVWRAVSEAEGLSNWFPLRASVEPGAGGSLTLSWGPGCEGTGTIEVWEPGRRLRWLEAPPGGAGESRVFVEIEIEGREGTTRVRLVHSGFEVSEDWSEYVDLVESGWRYFLGNLKHYLERHPGRSRHMVWRRQEVVGRSKEDVWATLLAPEGLAATPLPAAVGSPVQLWSRDDGIVHMSTPPLHFAARLPGLHDALLLIELEPGRESFHVGVWLSLYGVEDTRAESLQTGLDERLEKLLAG